MPLVYLSQLSPFSNLWAALYGPEGKVTGTIWTKQIAHSLSWLRAVFHQDTPGLIRRFHLADARGYLRVYGVAVALVVTGASFDLGAPLASPGSAFRPPPHALLTGTTQLPYNNTPLLAFRMRR